MPSCPVALYPLNEGSRQWQGRWYFFGLLFTHWLAQFIAWSYADHNALARVLWIVLATPLIHMAGSLANHYFWILASFNSVLWATTLTYVINRYWLKH